MSNGQQLVSTEPGLENRWTLFKTLPELVDKKYEQGMGYAEDAFRIAQETISKLERLASELIPIVLDINLDDITPPSIDDFVGSPPDPITVDFNMPTDLTESDEVLTAIKDKLYNDITTGGPAIPESVETAIFDRELERSELVHADELDNISAEWSKRGFVLPDGMLAQLLAQAEINYTNKRLDISRDISIKSFELSDTNTKFAVQQGLVWYNTRVETYKAKIQAEIARIEGIVKAFLGEAEVYKANAQVYEALTDAKIKKFDSEVKIELVNAEVLMKEAELNMKNYEMLNTLKIESMKAISAVAAQLVAGALSSVSAAVHLQAQNSADYKTSTAELLLANPG